MIWKTPKEGDVRTRKIFAFAPHACVDGKTRWLERLAVEEEYVFTSDHAFPLGFWHWEERKACPIADLCSCGEIDCPEMKARGKIAAHRIWPPPPPRDMPQRSGYGPR